jgi:chromosome segregation ATPase
MEGENMPTAPPRDYEIDGGYDDDGENMFAGVDELPIFASEENKELDREIKRKESGVEKCEDDLRENKERVGILSEHLNNVKQELVHTQALVDAKMKEIHTEDHLKQLAERELGRYQQEIEKIRAEESDTQDKLNTVQNGIFKGNEKMDQFKMQMDFNQEELEQWALAAKQKDEDNMALQKYTRADESKIKDLNLQIEKLTVMTSDKNSELENEITETQAKQIELDKTAEAFRAMHHERQQLVRQWQESIEAMKRRDEEIQIASENFQEAKQVFQEKKESLEENKHILKRQEADNSELQSAISLIERQLTQKRESHRNAQAKLQQFKDEVEVLKAELRSAANDLYRKREANTNLAADLEEKKIRLEDARKVYQAIKRRLEKEGGNKDKVEASAKMAEEDLNEKETSLKKADQTMAGLKDMMYKHSQELFNLRQQEANLIAEISGAQAASRNLATKIHQLDQSSLRQQELIYNAEFQIQQLERKVARASGERTGDEKAKLEKIIAELQKELDNAKSQQQMLSTQIRKLGDELRAQKRAFDTSVKNAMEYETKIAELELENNSALRSLKALMTEKEEGMVQHDVMRLEVKKLRDTLNSRADEVFTLENRKFQLQMSMEERKREISVHKDIQRAQLKAVEEEKHRVSMELQERTMKVDKLKNKYETLVKLSSVGSEGDGDRSQAFYVIEAAMKREELQREGDELDAKIRKCEREIRALEQTLKHLTARNTNFRQSFQRADMGGDDAKNLKRLEEAVKQKKDELFKRKKELQHMQTDYEDDQRRLEKLSAQTSELQEYNKHLESAHGQVIWNYVEKGLGVGWKYVWNVMCLTPRSY